MTIDIYRNYTRFKKYPSVPHGTDVTRIPFPPDFDPDLRQLCPFKSDCEIVSGIPLIAFDSDVIFRQIEEEGNATHATEVVITTSVSVQ